MRTGAHCQLSQVIVGAYRGTVIGHGIDLIASLRKTLFAEEHDR